jgi:sugar O-acyltransferase (sialic acid O-acetyltransferase NeuD family)
MTDRVIIVGGGGFGRELISMATDAHRAGLLPPVGGYLDDAGDVLKQFPHYDLPWLGKIDDYQPQPGDLFTLAIGSPKGKRALSDRLKVRGARFAQVIHPTSLTSPTCRMGEGVVIATFTGPGIDTRIGAFVTINSFSSIGHDASIGDFTTLSGHVDVLGGAEVGADVFIGSTASILPGVRIGDGANIGAGSIVYRSVKPGATVYAPPAKLLKL